MKYIILSILISLIAFFPYKTIATGVTPENKLQALQEMESSYETMNEEEKAHYGRFVGQALNRNDLFHTQQQILQKDPVDYMNFSIEYYIRNKKTNYLIDLFIYKGRYFLNTRLYSKAIESFWDGLEIAQKEKDLKSLGIIYNNLAILAGYLNDSIKKLEYLQKAIYYYEQTNNKEGAAGAYTTLSWAYSALEKDQEALSASRKALELTTDSIKIGDALLDIGSSYFYMEQSDSALYYMKKSLEYPSLYTVHGAKHVKIAQTYAAIKQLDSAYFYSKKALEYPLDIYFQINNYNVLIYTLGIWNKNDELSIYMSKLRIAEDSIRRLENQPSLSILEQIHQLDKQTIQIHDHQNYLIYLVILILSMSGFIIYILYKKQHYKKREAELYKTELEGKEQILVLQQKEFRKRREILLQEFNEELKQTREKYSEQRAKGSFEQRMKIDKTIYEEVLPLTNQESFTIKMNYLLNNLPDKLKRKYPEISHKEILWCCLFMLELPSNEIAFILDYKQTSLYKFKQRLIQKLNFNSAKELEQMLHNKMNT